MTTWPTPRYPGETIDIGSEQACELLDATPAEDRLYTFREIIDMMSGLGALPEGDSEWIAWAADHVEHMAIGGYVIGRPYS